MIVMNLVLDIGNTFSKYSVFNIEKIQDHGYWATDKIIEEFKTWIKNNPNCRSIIVSDVFGIDNFIFESIAKCKVIWVSHKIELPFKIEYKTPETLGADRISLISSVVVEYPKKNCLVIDLGTCITYDFVNDLGDYFGGTISPGFSLRYRSLNLYTSKLPQLDFHLPDNFHGTSTEKSIHSGIYYGIKAEVENQIAYYTKIYKNLTVILTGGDSDKLANQIKNGIFANHIFLAKGLYSLLKLNTKGF
tara:strand:- start:26587 stop:27327 length:741 start_codon:yes stop_codon:yes gene_type:complete